MLPPCDDHQAPIDELSQPWHIARPGPRLTRKVTLPIPLMIGLTPMLLYSSIPGFVGRCAIEGASLHRLYYYKRLLVRTYTQCCCTLAPAHCCACLCICMGTGTRAARAARMQ